MNKQSTMDRSNAKVSYIIVTYKQEKYVEDSLNSILSQKCAPLEIIISDDCSPDNTYETIQRVINDYNGPHTVIAQQTPKNLGLSGNLNLAWMRSTGDFLILQAGDDVAREDRAAKLIARWKDTSNKVDLVVSYFEEIREDGSKTGFIKKNVCFTPNIQDNPLNWTCGATGACASYSRMIFEKLGPINPRVIAEDWVYSFRAWLESGIAVIEEPLLLHRTHDESISVLLGNSSIRKQESSESRMNIRKKATNGNYGIAIEWMKAAKASNAENKDTIVKKLDNRLRVWEMATKAYDTTRLGALRYVLPTIWHGGGIKRAVKIIIRNVLRYH